MGKALMHLQSWRDIIESERGLTLLEIMVTLVIVCMFAVVFTQFMGISFKDIFAKGDKMQAAASAQNMVEKISAVVESNSEENLDDALTSLKEYVAEDALLVYDAALPVRFYYDKSDPKEVSDEYGTDDVEGIDVSVVVFYNNGASYVRYDNFIFTG